MSRSIVEDDVGDPSRAGELKEQEPGIDAKSTLVQCSSIGYGDTGQIRDEGSVSLQKAAAAQSSQKSRRGDAPR